MTPPSNEVLDEKFKNMEKQNTIDHWALDLKLDKIMTMLDDKFVLKSSFKIAMTMLWLFATILALASYVGSMKF